MKRKFRSIVALVLCVLMTVPFSAMANAAELTIPSKPSVSSTAVVYTAYAEAYDENGTKLNSAVGNAGTGINDLYKTSAFSYWLNLFDDGGSLADGGYFVVVGKAAVPITTKEWNNHGIIPATTNPVVFTAKDPATGYNYTSRNTDGTLNYMSSTGLNQGQYGMFMIDPEKTLTFEGDVIFRDIVILNRQSVSTASKTPAVIQIKGKMVVESTVEFARMTGNVMYSVDVVEGAYLYLDTLGFDGYTGEGTIVVGNEILSSVTEDTFAGFEGTIVDENGNELFAEDPGDPEEPVVPEKPTVPEEPSATSDKVIFVTYDSNVNAGIAAVTPSVDGGDTATEPYYVKTGLWTPLFNTGKAKDGGTIVIVGKGFIGDNLTIPVTADPIVFTSVYNGIDYTSYNSDGTYNAVNGTGQFGSVLIAGGKTLTISGVVIFDNTTVFNRSSSTGTIKVDGQLVVKDNVSFATLTAGKEHLLEVSSDGVAFLHSLGFGGYSGTGTIVVGDEILSMVTEETFAGFEGIIVDENGNELFVEEPIPPEEPDEPEIPKVPERPSVNGTDKIYLSYALNNPNGTAASANGGNSIDNAYATSKSPWANLLSTSGAATTVEGNTNFTNGGTIVVVGKGYVGTTFTFPATTNTLVITAKDGDVSYISRNADGTLNLDGTLGQLGMFMGGIDNTINFAGDVIFRDIVILNRYQPVIYNVTGRFVVEDTVEFAQISGQYPTLNVEEGGVAFVDVAGFGKYTGKGTLVLGDAAIDAIRKADISEFEGTVIDKNGNAVDLFPKSEPESSSDKVIYIVHDKTEAGVAGSTTGGATPDLPYKTGGADGWKNLLNGEAKDGGTIVLAGKGFIGANFTFPATTSPLVFTSVYNGTSYISKDAEGELYFMSSTGGHAGQYGMFILSKTHITFEGDVIFTDTVILNRLSQTQTDADNSTITVNGRLVISNTVQFAKMTGKFGYHMNVSEGAYLYLHADPSGFDSYSGKGVIVIGDEIINTVEAKMFEGFEGRIVDKLGNDVFTDENSKITGTTGDCEFSYNYITGVLTVTGNGVPGSLTYARRAKQVIFGEGVTAIPDNFCFNNTDLEEVTISSTITSIGRYAFGNTANLKTVNIPADSTVASIGFKAFLFSGITSITFNDNLKTIDGYAFRGCYDLETVALGNGIESIGEYAFGYNYALKSITFGGTLTEIADNTFIGAKSLTTIVIPDTVTIIGTKAFMGAASLTTVDFSDAITTINADAFKDTGITGVVTLPDTVTEIGDRVFYNCANLTEVKLPEGLVSLGKYVYARSGITTASFPDGITTIPEKTFYNAKSLVSVELGSNITTIKSNAFAGSGITSIVIPASCTSIGNGIFWSCTELTSATVNANISSLPYKTFYGCSALTTVVFPENTSITDISALAFYGCSSLSTIELPDGLTSIGDYVFSHSGISSITLPDGITRIPAKAFEKCSSLTSFTVGENITEIGDYAFAESGITSFVIPEQCTAIGTGLFYNCDKLVTVEAKAPLKAITYKMFYDCDALETFDIPDTVTSIRPFAFYSCGNLSDIGEGGIPSGLKYLYNHAFASTTNLKIDIHLPGTLITPPVENIESEDWVAKLEDKENTLYNAAVGYYCFFGSGITGVTFGEGIESIAWASFYNCRNMTGDTIEIPESMTTIGGKAFANTPVYDVYIPATVTEIGSYAFFRKESGGKKIDQTIFIHTEESAEAVVAWAASNTNEVICVTDYTPGSVVTVPVSYNKQFDASKSYRMYNYCPSVMQVDEDTMYIYYCTNKTSGNVTDYIGFREATKGADGKWTWSAETIVLSPSSGTWDERHVCDPSVVMGDFTYNGEQYSYLMAYLGCVTSDNQENEIGLAVAKSPSGPFVKVGSDAFIGYDRDTTVDQSVFQWGVGQASLININKQGEIMLFYTMGAPSGTHTMVEKWDLSDLNNPVKITDTVKLSETGLKTLTGKQDIINNADFVYDAESKRFYASSDCHPNPSSEPNFISSDFRVTYFNDTGDFSKVTWRELCTVGEDETGFARNHNTGILRDAYGHLANDYISVYYTISNTGSNSLWSYRIYDFHTPKAK